VLDENGFGGGGSCEWFRILVSMLNPFVDCGFEFRDVVENASPYTLSGDFGEEPLDEVEPGAGRGVKCKMKRLRLVSQRFTTGVLWVA
jgi:hypothetical protein